MKKINEFLSNKNVSAVVGMLVGTIIYCMGIVFVLDLGSFYAGGITGISQAIESVMKMINPKFAMIGFKSIIIALFNVPLFLTAWKGVSKRFAIISLTSVLLQVGIIALFEYIYSLGFSPFEAIQNDRLTLSILGGLITGAGCGISLKVGASTGGMDVISQYVSLKKHMSFAKVSMSIDLSIVMAGAIIGYIDNGSLDIAVYTVIRLIIAILVLDKIHTIYKYSKVTIITEEKQRMRDALLGAFNHGITIFSAVGGFSNKPKYVLESIVWSFETAEYTRIAKKVDPNSFITCSAVKRVEGTFNINVIA